MGAFGTTEKVRGRLLIFDFELVAFSIVDQKFRKEINFIRHEAVDKWWRMFYLL